MDMRGRSVSSKKENFIYPNVWGDKLIKFTVNVVVYIVVKWYLSELPRV